MNHWTRWIISSVSNHFAAYKMDLTYFIEGGVLDKNVIKYLQLRYDGPHYNKTSKDYTIADVTINLFIQIPKSNNIYTISDYIDGILAGFTSIDIYKYGSDSESDSSYFGCLNLEGKIITEVFDQTIGNVEVNQGMIEAKFVLETKNG